MNGKICFPLSPRINERTGKSLPPLKPATLRRMAEGLRRYVLENPRAFRVERVK